MSLYSDALVNRGRECCGLSYGDPSTRAAYLAHQYPGDTPAVAGQLGREQSGCLLHLRGLLAERQLDGEGVWRGQLLDLLRCSYGVPERIGTVEGLLQEWCRQRGGGLRSYQGPTRPELEDGEFVIIGEGLATHGLLVLSVDGDQVTSSDGGQTDPRNGGRPTAILERTRTLTRSPAGVWLLGGRALRWGWR